MLVKNSGKLPIKGFNCIQNKNSYFLEQLRNIVKDSTRSCFTGLVMCIMFFFNLQEIIKRIMEKDWQRLVKSEQLIETRTKDKAFGNFGKYIYTYI